MHVQQLVWHGPSPYWGGSGYLQIRPFQLLKTRITTQLPEHSQAIGDNSFSGWAQTSHMSTLYPQTCLRYPGPSTSASLPSFGQSNPPVVHAAFPPYTAGLGLQAGVRCKWHTGCRLNCGIQLQKSNPFIKYGDCNKAAAVCLSLAHKTITSEVTPWCFRHFENIEPLTLFYELLGPWGAPSNKGQHMLGVSMKEEQTAFRQRAISPHRGDSPAAKQQLSLHGKYHFRPVFLGNVNQKLLPNKSNKIRSIILGKQLQALRQLCKAIFKFRAESSWEISAWGQKIVSFPFW